MPPVITVDADEAEYLGGPPYRLLEDAPDAGSVDLLVDHARLEPAELQRGECVPQRAQRSLEGPAAHDDPGGILGAALQVLLPVRVRDLWMREQHDAGLAIVHARQPRP